MTNSISLCLIARDEEHNIARCIKSAIPFVDEIILVDTGSKDKTMEIAKKLGARVYEIPWEDDFSKARNESLAKATGDWILFLDCDEELDQQTVPNLKKVVNDSNFQGYWLHFINIIDNIPITSFPAFRLFRNNPLYRFASPIHEQILPSILRHHPKSTIGYTDIIVYHYGYATKEHADKQKAQRNIRILEKARQHYGDAGFISFYLGVESQKTGNYSQALDFYQKSLRKSSSESYIPAMIRSIVGCYINLSRYQDGLDFLESHMGSYPDYTDLVYLKGHLHYQLGQYQEALDCMNKCIDMGPPPKHYFTSHGIGREKPASFILSTMEQLINQGAQLFEQGQKLKAFTTLNQVYTQLKKTPHRECYHNLIKTILGFTLHNNRANPVLELTHREFFNRIRRLDYVKKPKLVKKTEPIQNPIHVVYLLGQVSICGGVKIILEHANHLTNQGIKITLISHFPKPNWFPIDANYQVIPFGIDLARGIPYDANLIVATYWDQIASCVEMGTAPVVYFEQGYNNLFSWDKSDPEVKEIIQKSYQLAAEIITVSENVAQRIKDIFNRESQVFHNALDNTIFYPKKQPSKKRYILAVGGDHTKFKRIPVIGKAYHRLLDMGYDIDFKWVTPYQPKEPIGNVIINPSQQELGDLYRNAYIFVCASDYESFSLPVLEAMSCGTPVISTPNDGVKSYGIDGENCLFVQPCDPKTLADKIILLLENPDLYKKLQENGCKTAAKFSWSQIIPRLKSYYQQLACYKPLGASGIDDWEKVLTVKFNSQEETVIQDYLKSTAADNIYVPFTFNIADLSITRWYLLFKRRIQQSGEQDYLYLPKEMPLDLYPYRDIVSIMNTDPEACINNFKDYLSRTDNPMECAILIRWIIWCLIETKSYSEAQRLLIKSIRNYQDYADFYYLLYLLASKLESTKEIQVAKKGIHTLGDSAGYPEYITNIRQLIRS